MDVPLALKDIGIRYGLKGFKRKSSTYYHLADAVGLSALYVWLLFKFIIKVREIHSMSFLYNRT